jgi:hypothetical protein
MIYITKREAVKLHEFLRPTFLHNQLGVNIITQLELDCFDVGPYIDRVVTNVVCGDVKNSISPLKITTDIMLTTIERFIK